MKITILQPFNTKDATEAWRLSRDPQAVTPFSDIAGVDAPVNEIPSAVLHFENFTILEREIFTTLRNHIMWARTSRVDDPLRFMVPPGFNVHTAPIRERMRAAQAAGMPQDVWRGYLPVLAYTAWTARHNMRDLAKLMMYFSYLAHKLPPLMAQRCYDIAERLAHVLPPGQDWSTYKLEHYLCEEFLYDRPGVITTDHYTVLRVQIPLMLRAQLVRHRPISFVDDLWHLLNNLAVASHDLTTKVTMECSAPTSFWQAIATKRNCWIAQFDLWAPVLKALDNSGVMLPCSNGAPCPYAEDNKLRYAGKDPNPICPIYANREHLTKDRAAMQVHAADRQAFWQEEINR